MGKHQLGSFGNIIFADIIIATPCTKGFGSLCQDYFAPVALAAGFIRSESNEPEYFLRHRNRRKPLGSLSYAFRKLLLC